MLTNADFVDALSGAHLIDAHCDDPDDEWRAVYAWNGSLTVNIYGVSADGAECVDVFTFSEKPTRGQVLARIAEHWRESVAYADAQ